MKKPSHPRPTSPLFPLFSAIAGAILTLNLLSCGGGGVGHWGDHELGRAEFEATLMDQGPEAEKAARFSPEATEAAVLVALTNRVLAFDAVRRAGAARVFETPAFSNLALWVRSQELDRNLTPRAAGLTEAQARTVTFAIDTEILYRPAPTLYTNGRHEIGAPLQNEIETLQSNVAASTNWRSMAGTNLGYSMIPVSWGGIYHGHMPRLTGLPMGTVVGPLTDANGVFFLRPQAVRAMAADEIAQGLRRDDVRADMAKAVGRLRRAEWVKNLRNTGEKEGLLAWHGGESLSRALSRASNVYGARAWPPTLPPTADPTNALLDLLEEFPLVVHRRDLPPSATPRTLPLPVEPGWAVVRWWDGWMNGRGEKLHGLGLADLSNAVALGPDRDSQSKRERLASRAHRRLAQAWVGRAATWGQAVSHGRRFIAIGDYEKAHWWFQRALLSSGRRPGELESILSPKAPRNREALVWVEALGASGDPAWIPFLAAQLQVAGQNDEGKVLLVEALGRLPDRGQAMVLLPYYKDSREIWGVRLMAAKSLERLTGRKHPLDTPAPK